MSHNPSQQPVQHTNSPLLLSDPGKMADSSYEQNLRRSIISIHNDSSLSPPQKAKKIQVKLNLTSMQFNTIKNSFLKFFRN
jgi:hypothetical protein